jgi:hypothetical protein
LLPSTGLRPGEWVALEYSDVDRAGRGAYVKRSFSKGKLTSAKTEASIRAVPLQAAQAAVGIEPFRRIYGGPPLSHS